VTFDDRYAIWAKRSRELFDQASEIIPGGAGSSARTAKFGWMPYPPFMACGTGSRITDVDGHEYVDFLVRFTNSGSEAVGSAIRIAPI
jgi:glutamate-1-semialdehyde 2,1-aminomutase